MALRRSICALACASSLLGAGCFGELGAESTTETEGSSGLATTSTGLQTSGELSSSSSGGSVCEHLDILVITDVSLSMAPFAQGIVELFIAMGARLDETFEGLQSYNIALTYNVAPVVNELAFEVPAEGDGCTQLGALVRGIDECVEEFDGRPYLTKKDQLGTGLECIAGGLSSHYDLSHERPRALDSVVAFLESGRDDALSACNAGFHDPSDPLLIVLIVDSDDESDLSPLEAATSAIGAEGSSLENIGVFLIGADASNCPDEEANECGAEPACQVQEFLDIGFNNASLGANLRRFNLCRAHDERGDADVAAVADDLIAQMSAVFPALCAE